MLKNDVLSLGQVSGAFEGPEGDEGVEETLAEPALSLPTPKIVRSSPMRLPGDGEETSMGHFKGRDLGGESHAQGCDADGVAAAQAHHPDAPGPKGHAAGHHGRKGAPLRRLLDEATHQTVHLGLKGGRSLSQRWRNPR